jgi:polyisoprenoid-binding protein YceI
MTANSITRVALPEAGTYVIDPRRSTALFSSRHMFGMGTVHAEFSIVSGELSVAATLQDSTVTVALDPSSFSSSSAKRDKDVKSAALLDVATWPEITFSSEAVHEVGDGVLIDGTLTAHGTAVPVQVAVATVTNESDGVRVRARATRLDRYSFGITKSKGMVGRFMDVDFDVFAVRA